MSLEDTFSNIKEQCAYIVTQIKHSVPYPVQIYMETYMSTLPRAINHILLLMFVCNAFFFLGAINVYHFPNMGFNTFVVSFSSFVHNVAMWMVFNNPDHQRFNLTNTEFTVGVMMGVCMGMSIVFFITCHYYGQLMKCQVVEDDIKQYVCENKGAMWSVWFFGSFMFMLNLALVVLIKNGNEDLTGGIQGGGYEEVQDEGLRFEGDFPSVIPSHQNSSGNHVTTLHV